MDAAAIITALHSRTLRHLSVAAGVHFSGLEQASRSRQLSLSNHWRRKLQHLDHAFNTVRHVTEISANDFFCELVIELASEQQMASEAPHIHVEAQPKHRPLPTLVALRGGNTKASPDYPRGASSSQSSAVMAEMRIDVAGDGGTYTEQEFRDYYKDNFVHMWNAAKPTPILKRLEDFSMDDGFTASAIPRRLSDDALSSIRNVGLRMSVNARTNAVDSIGHATSAASHGHDNSSVHVGHDDIESAITRHTSADSASQTVIDTSDDHMGNTAIAIAVEIDVSAVGSQLCAVCSGTGWKTKFSRCTKCS